VAQTLFCWHVGEDLVSANPACPLQIEVKAALRRGNKEVKQGHSGGRKRSRIDAAMIVSVAAIGSSF